MRIREARVLRSRLFQALQRAEARIGPDFDPALSLRIDRLIAALEALGGKVDQLRRAA